MSSLFDRPEKEMYSRETELRHLKPNDVYKLGVILDDNNCWKKLMEIIPKELNAQTNSADGSLDWEKVTNGTGLKYNNDHIRLIENAIKRPGESRLFSQILFEEWGTSGRRHERPTVGVLLQLLVQAELFRAADFVATTLLKEPPPERPLDGPAARIDITIPDSIFQDIQDMVNDTTFYPGTVSLNENANITSLMADNNKDYYTKYQLFDKHVNMLEEITNSNSNNRTTNTINDNTAATPKPPPRTIRNTRQQQQEHEQEQVQVQEQQLLKSPKTVSEVTTVEAPQQLLLASVDSKVRGVARNVDATLDNAVPLSQNLPKFPSLLSDRTVSDSNPTASTSASATSTQHTESTNLSEAPIPLISILAVTSNLTTSGSTENVTRNSMDSMVDSRVSLSETENYPVISALNLNGERDESMLSGMITSSLLLSSSRTSSLSDESVDEMPLSATSNAVRAPGMHLNEGFGGEIAFAAASSVGNDVCSVEGDDIDDCDDDSVPNLSIFEQRSSNNDSSLTTVTGTSGESSFELSINDSSLASNEDNIPCLSALKQ